MQMKQLRTETCNHIQPRIQIERQAYNVPVRSKRSIWADLFSQMDVGDSFLITPRMMSAQSITNAKITSVRSAAKRLGMKITCRTIDEDCMRVWRIK
jgi:hypothetical protein